MLQQGVTLDHRFPPFVGFVAGRMLVGGGYTSGHLGSEAYPFYLQGKHINLFTFTHTLFRSPT
jgi:hypothetical protein